MLRHGCSESSRRLSRAGIHGADDTEQPLRTVHMLFTSLKVGAPTPARTFDLAYRIVPSS